MTSKRSLREKKAAPKAQASSEAEIGELVLQLKSKIKTSFPENTDGKINEQIASLLGIGGAAKPQPTLERPKARSKKVGPRVT